ncbi:MULTISPECIES: hypothetical protein [Rhizobium]|uniref:hypothetical protein n=1 Tax=Rhizobium phaseoli TaxID=396 RepID=UPI00184D8B13|nr:hypothetical protein [Rhizobium phaseoli]
MHQTGLVHLGIDAGRCPGLARQIERILEGGERIVELHTAAHHPQNAVDVARYILRQVLFQRFAAIGRAVFADEIPGERSCQLADGVIRRPGLEGVIRPRQQRLEIDTLAVADIMFLDDIGEGDVRGVEMRIDIILGQEIDEGVEFGIIILQGIFEALAGAQRPVDRLAAAVSIR